MVDYVYVVATFCALIPWEGPVGINSAVLMADYVYVVGTVCALIPWEGLSALTLLC